MDDIARLPAADRADLFVVTGTGRGLTSEMIEKDFWVYWTLKRPFTLPDPPAGLLFKGGTSLSKVFGIIERFSEDVDLSFDRAGLGFGGESDPLNAPTGKRRMHGLEALTETCQRIIRERLLPQLVNVFGKCAGGRLKRLPSSVYWAELGIWQIRRYQGSQDQYHTAIEKIYSLRRTRSRSADAERKRGERLDAIHEDAAITWH